MRIIGGKFKGKKILSPKDKVTRPLKDLVKESIFNILNHSNKHAISLNDSNILDLFSGVGSFGLEAISRGAKFVIFIEKYLSVNQILKKNIYNLNVVKKCKVIDKDIFDNIDFKKLYLNFDLIFLDPPFKEKKIFFLFEKIYYSNILKKNGLIILHRHSKEIDNFPNFINIIEIKNYGKSKIFFLNFFKK